jgi:DNA polymerase-3 subunit delta'
MNFKEIIGQPGPVQVLKNALLNHRVAHAYLFSGPRGIGKTTIARAFAQAFLCEQGKLLGDSCGECASCQKLNRENHPDLKTIEPQGVSLKIDQIRELVQKVYFKAYDGQGRVYILADVDTMTTEAANSFLKILEEPPEEVLFILISSQPYKLLPTIVSRCQVLQFFPLSNGDMEIFLVDRHSISKERAIFVASMAHGIITRALESIQSEDLEQQRKKIVEISQILFKGDVLQAFQTAEELEKKKDELVKTLGLLATWYRDLLVWKTTQHEELLINADMVNGVQQGSQNFSQRRLLQNLATIEQTKGYLNANVNNRLALENMCLDLLGG